VFPAKRQSLYLPPCENSANRRHPADSCSPPKRNASAQGEPVAEASVRSRKSLPLLRRRKVDMGSSHDHGRGCLGFALVGSELPIATCNPVADPTSHPQ
jgi:hypothetical protein